MSYLGFVVVLAIAMCAGILATWFTEHIVAKGFKRISGSALFPIALTFVVGAVFIPHDAVLVVGPIHIVYEFIFLSVFMCGLLGYVLTHHVMQTLSKK